MIDEAHSVRIFGEMNILSTTKALLASINAGDKKIQEILLNVTFKEDFVRMCCVVF